MLEILLRQRLAAIVCLGAFALASPGNAATVTANTPAEATIDYLHNWNAATVSDGVHLLPAASVPDTAVINLGKTVEVTSPVSVDAGPLVVSNTNSGQNRSFLTVSSGGDLTVAELTISSAGDPGTINVQGGVLTVGGPTSVNTNGVLNLSGGSFTNSAAGPRSIFSDTSGAGGVVNITSGTLTALGAQPTDVLRFEADAINISGGIINATGGQVLLADTTSLTINGSAADITLDRLNLNTTQRAATVNFNFDASGVSPIKNGSFLNLSHATLNIDGSGYTGGANTFDLFIAPNVNSTASPANINITGFGVDGVDYTFLQSTSSNVVRLEVLGSAAPDRFTRVDLAGGESVFNGSFESVTIDLGLAGQNAKITGSNTSFDPHEANEYTVDQWEPFFSDPNDVISRYGNAGTVTTNAWYLTAISSINAGAGEYDGERGILLDSAEGYQHGLVNVDFLADLDPKLLNPNAQYKLTFEVTRRVNTLPGDANGVATIFVTDSLTDPTDPSQVVAGGLFTANIGDLPIGTTEFELILSGAELANADQLNLGFQQVNNGVIGVEDTPGQDRDFVSQLVVDNFILQGYLPGDSDGDFDVDAADYAAWKQGFGGVGGGDHTAGDFNGDGEVDAADYTLWRDNFTGELAGAPATAAPEPTSLLPLFLPAILRRPRRANRRQAAADRCYITAK